MVLAAYRTWVTSKEIDRIDPSDYFTHFNRLGDLDPRDKSRTGRSICEQAVTWIKSSFGSTGLYGY